ncbi:helix-turn-helix domain-containing protein [Tardiphaga sp. 20_F10_N6_6]|uniref:helix-turn-helix domain-containing protein n=1 Tax=Tardiphaga sp. 20_F10_N6_6 TaxID=3240788 RepID=UPI003F89A600
MSGLNKLRKFAQKIYRDGYLRTQVGGGIAYQIQALREKLGLTQTEFAEITGKKQSVISRLEDTSYGKVTVQTLLDIACATDVALVVKFVSYPDFLRQTEDMTVRGLQPDTIRESLARAERSSFYVIENRQDVYGRADAAANSYQRYETPLHDRLEMNDNSQAMSAFKASSRSEMRILQ